MKTLKKGFTIVELVIVIAVIAILAAVLIPTFSGVVSNANSSAALQTARSTLTSTLNMSSVAQLKGYNETLTAYQTNFVVEDTYTFRYTGNQLEAADYEKASLVYGKNYNTIVISASIFSITSDTNAEGKVSEETITNTLKDLTGATDVKYKNSATTGKYIAKLTGAKKVTSATDSAVTTGEVTVEVLLNSDYSKKVVCFTMFDAAATN